MPAFPAICAITNNLLRPSSARIFRCKNTKLPLRRPPAVQTLNSQEATTKSNVGCFGPQGRVATAGKVAGEWPSITLPYFSTSLGNLTSCGGRTLLVQALQRVNVAGWSIRIGMGLIEARVSIQRAVMGEKHVDSATEADMIAQIPNSTASFSDKAATLANTTLESTHAGGRATPSGNTSASRTRDRYRSCCKRASRSSP